MTNQKLKQSLINSISNIQGNGSFYSYGKLNFIIPRMKVGSKLEVSLPLQQDTATKLINYAVQAPYGKGNDTLVDTKIRKTWEIDGGDITFENPAWQKLLVKVVSKVKDDFSLQDVDVEPHLYKLLIYEKGGFFLKHKDTEKEKGMFASLVINLPSDFSGGELEIEWNGKSKKIDFSSHIYDIAFAAFYSDCNHEVHPVKSGYRISLIYNLVKVNNGAQLGLSTLVKAVDEVSEILVQMKSNKIEKPFLYLLEHQYTPTNFAFNKLKDNDINRSEAILQAAKKAGYFADLGLLNHHIDGELDYNDYGYREEIDPESVTMSAIIDEYILIEDWLGIYYPAIRELSLEEVEILNNRNYKDIEEAISSNAEGYMGNYGPSIEYDYHIGAILLMPFNSMGMLIANASGPVLLGWIDYFFNSEIDNVDFDDLINKFLSIESRIDNWEKNSLDILVDCIGNNLVQNNKEKLVSFISENVYALSSKKAVLFVEVLNSKEINNFLKSALVTNENRKNLLAVLKLYLRLESKVTVANPNIFTNHSEFIFRCVNLIFKDLDIYNFNVINEDKLVTKILKTILKISDHISINHFLEPTFSKCIDRKFIYKYLAPIVEKSQENRNDLWQLLHELLLEKLKSYTKTKPQKPIDWTRDFSFNGKINTQLEILKSYLEDSENETYVYVKAQDFRRKMENLILLHQFDISCMTIKKGSPHQLHLTKNENSFHIKLKDYQEDIRMLESIESNWFK